MSSLRQTTLPVVRSSAAPAVSDAFVNAVRDLWKVFVRGTEPTREESHRAVRILTIIKVLTNQPDNANQSAYGLIRDLVRDDTQIRQEDVHMADSEEVISLINPPAVVTRASASNIPSSRRATIGTSTRQSASPVAATPVRSTASAPVTTTSHSFTPSARPATTTAPVTSTVTPSAPLNNRFSSLLPIASIPSSSSSSSSSSSAQSSSSSSITTRGANASVLQSPGLFDDDDGPDITCSPDRELTSTSQPLSPADSMDNFIDDSNADVDDDDEEAEYQDRPESTLIHEYIGPVEVRHIDDVDLDRTLIRFRCIDKDQLECVAIMRLGSRFKGTPRHTREAYVRAQDMAREGPHGGLVAGYNRAGRPNATLYDGNGAPGVPVSFRDYQSYFE